jgi:hypothetical protein
MEDVAAEASVLDGALNQDGTCSVTVLVVTASALSPRQKTVHRHHLAYVRPLLTRKWRFSASRAATGCRPAQRQGRASYSRIEQRSVYAALADGVWLYDPKELLKYRQINIRRLRRSALMDVNSLTGINAVQCGRRAPLALRCAPSNARTHHAHERIERTVPHIAFHTCMTDTGPDAIVAGPFARAQRRKSSNHLCAGHAHARPDI